MSGYSFEVGRVVQSRSGRDAGRYFVVLQVLDDQYVLIADGMLRKVEAPKRKKLKHLIPKPEFISSLQGKLTKGESVLDAEVRKSLETLGYGRPTKED